MNTFNIESNDYLEKGVNGFFNTNYVGYQKFGNPDFLNILKNDKKDREVIELQSAVNTVEEILKKDLPRVLNKLGWNKALICCMPRAKAKDSYTKNQLLFTKVVSVVADSLRNFKDGTNYITRKINTRTTHLKYSDTEGRMPYAGIARDTCKIKSNVRGKNIILIDDIYTKTVNVNEDMIQALLQAGARSVALYAVAKTLYRKQ